MVGTGVSLIPRSSKTTKKKRIAFRPATKKSNQNKNKSGSSISKASSAGKDAPSNLPAQSVPARKTITGNDEASKPLSSKSNTEQSLPQDKSREIEAMVNTPTAAETENTTPTEPTAKTITRESSATTTTSSAATRKRKANPLNNLIRVGSSLRKKTVVSTSTPVPVVAKDRTNDVSSGEDNEKTTNETAIVPTSKPQNDDEKQNDENIVPLGTKEPSTATNAPPPSAIFPELSARDQATLKQLSIEGNPEGKSLLNSFCSGFKGPKRKLRDRLGGSTGLNNKGKQNNKNTTNNGSGDNSGTGETSAADSSNDKTAAPSVQIIDGEIVLQESSVMFPARRTVQEVEEEYQDNVVEEDEQLNLVQASYTSFITKGDHGKTRNKGLWTIKETELFYVALQQLGTDFGSMEALFFENKRTRRQLKNKYRKELTKNPNLVQELALNPKYQTALDMTAFNLEVDPKRIEAHKNEEPPAYEPTDEEGLAITPEVPKKENDMFEGEVVEEDAEEERRAEASAAVRSSGDSSLWPTTGEKHYEAENGGEFGDEMGGFPSEEGPSMDDFFHDDSYNGNEEPEQETSAKESAATIKQDNSELVSLVPKKASSKSRRPKIRPSARRKIK
eukprot:jgi/Psemu1/289562/fgenesh1_pg.371_\